MKRSVVKLSLLLTLVTACGLQTKKKPDSSLAGLEARPDNQTCLAFSRPQENASVTLQRLGTENFKDVVGLQLAPGSDRFYVVRRTGFVESFLPGDGKPKSTFIDIRAIINSGPSEGGLLGMAWHPTRKGEFYLSYTSPSPNSPANLRSVIARFKANDELSAPVNPEILLTLEQPYENHNGGHIAFGPDGYLYIALGDGGAWGDPQGNSQDLSKLFGKMLRIDVGPNGPYSIPQDNPFIDKANARPEIYAYGLRNPWRFHFDKVTGDLWAADVGQDLYEEVNRIVKGGNFGWKLKEGYSCYNGANCANADVVDPVYVYGRDMGASVTGGFVYRGNAVPSLKGIYVFGDFMTGNVWGLFPDENGKFKGRLLMATGFNISSFGEDHSGEIYVLEYGNGAIHKIVPKNDAASAAFAPSLLSKTGCFQANKVSEPTAGLIPYEVNSPLWSDGAAKRRWMALPNGSKIDIAENGHFEFPKGSVLVKEFALEGKIIETRLFIRHDDGVWAGYTYVWRDDGSDAELVLNGASKKFGEKSWNYPSQAQCLQCHNANAGFSLGLDIGQVNRKEQLENFAKIGLFSQALPSQKAVYPTPGQGVSAAESSRAYIHANCSFCHQPGGPGGGGLDLRYKTELSATGLCNKPGAGDFGIQDARLVFPGSPDKSVLLRRIGRRGAQQMPPLATNVVDSSAMAWVRDWISNLDSCEADPVTAGDVLSLESRFSHKCVDLDNGKPANGTNIQQWTCDGGQNQNFRVQAAGNGAFNLVNVKTGKCLDVTAKSVDNGANIQQWECSGGLNQALRFVPSAEDSFQLRFEHSGKCLEVAGMSAENRANIHQWECGGGARQDWLLLL